MTSAASRSEQNRLGRLGHLVRHSWPSARPLYTVLAVGTVLPALPAAAEISLFGIAFAQRVGRGGNAKLIGWQGNLVLAALVIPVLAVCAYLIARSWTAAAWLAAESSAGHADYRLSLAILISAGPLVEIGECGELGWPGGGLHVPFA